MAQREEFRRCEHARIIGIMLLVDRDEQRIATTCRIVELLVVGVGAPRTRPGIEERVGTECLKLEEIKQHAHIGPIKP